MAGEKRGISDRPGEGMEPGGVEPPLQPCEGCVLPLNHGPVEQGIIFVFFGVKVKEEALEIRDLPPVNGLKGLKR